ncbi:MAG: preprotein translocase subunit SecG [Syntrophothermus sp.]
MTTFLMVLQIVASIVMILVVLLQSSKGEGLGSIGGGTQMFFTQEKGLEGFLNRATTVVAVVFMVISIIVAAVAF